MRSASPRLFGIIGYPLVSTWSPDIHEAGFRALGLTHRYIPLAVAPARLDASLKALRQLGVRGLNVTVPHKEAVVPHLSTASPLVRTLGAANTLLARPRGWHGDNTDVAGFAWPLWKHARKLKERSALVIGAGGAARAVVYALLKRFDMSAVLVVARKARRAQEVATWAAALKRSAAVSAAKLSDTRAWRGAFSEAALVVQATPVGQGDGGRVLPAGRVFRRGQLACDLIYGYETDFLKRARKAGAKVFDGSGMLLAQAALAFELFTGRAYPWRAVNDQLKRRGS